MSVAMGRTTYDPPLHEAIRRFTDTLEPDTAAGQSNNFNYKPIAYDIIPRQAAG